MRTVRLTERRRKLGFYLRLAASGETVHLPYRGKVIAAIIPPRDRTETLDPAPV